MAYKDKDPTNDGFWNPLALGLKTRMLNVYVYVNLWGPMQLQTLGPQIGKTKSYV